MRGNRNGESFQVRAAGQDGVAQTCGIGFSALLSLRQEGICQAIFLVALLVTRPSTLTTSQESDMDEKAGAKSYRCNPALQIAKLFYRVLSRAKKSLAKKSA